MPRRPTGRPSGRPPYPDLLTPAEQRVLEHVRDGRTNAEIAVVLDLSPETVKYHVANMLSKLGLHDRRELAAWEPGEAPVPARRSPVAIVAAWLRMLGVRLVLAAILAGAAALAVTLVFVLRSSGPEPGTGGVEPAATPKLPAAFTVKDTPPRRFTAHRVTVHDLQAGTAVVVSAEPLFQEKAWWAPDRPLLALGYDRYLAFYDAPAQRWLVTTLSAPVAGAWSPDGSRFAYLSPEAGVYVLRTVDPASASSARVADTTGGPRAAYPPHRFELLWSPDGRWLAMVSPGRDRFALRLFDTATWSPVPLDALDDPSPALVGWPDDEHLLVLGGDPRRLTLLRVSAAAVTIERQSTLDAMSASLSPDGSRLVVQQGDSAHIIEALTFAEVATLDVDARGWSPDGRRLLAVRGPCGEELLSVDPTTGEETPLLGRWRLPAAEWSPDSTLVAVADKFTVAIMPADGSAPPRTIAEPTHEPSAPRFSADGRFLSFEQAPMYSDCTPP